MASLILVIYFARASPVHMIATIVVFALLWAILENLFDTAGAASIPAAVAGHQLETANGLLTAAQRIVQGFVFVPIAAAALAFHAPFPFILAGILMLASSLLARRISPGIRLSKDDASPVHEKWHTAISEGFRFIFATPSLRALVLLNAILLILLQFSQGAIAYYLIYTIGMPSAAFGLVLVGPAAGSVLGALSAKRIADRIGTKASMIVGALSLAIGLIALGLTPQRPWIALAVTLVLLAVSVGTGWWNVLAMSFIQRIVPAGLLGRVTGSIGTVIGAVLPLATLGGAIVSRWEPRLPWLMGGVLAIVATVGFVRGLPDHASSP